MVFYLKYRPKKISELDSQTLVEKLSGILKGKLPDNIPHAFLFTGSKGLGKTSTARILAKSINCTNRKNNEIEPCNICASCKSITNGSNLDVLEIDAASNRGIDEIRDLREKIRLAPVSSKKKIYIIDEVHMLTTEAFNALLKTLEEPPNHAFFVLCTTEGQKIPQTIVSRCFHIKFNKATEGDLMHSFQRIAKGEGIKIDKEALRQIAKLSDGSFRDGAKILEELSLSSKNITVSLIEKKYKTASIAKFVSDLISSFEKKDAKSGIKIVGKLADENVDFKLFVENLISALHANLIAQVGGQKFEMSLDETKRLIEMLAKSYVSIKYAVLPELPLELTIVEWAASTSNVAQANAASPSSENEEVSKVPHVSRVSKGDRSSEIIESEEQSSSSQKVANSSNSPRHDKILGDLIEAVKKENFSIAGVLRGCKVERFDKKELILSTGFKFHKERLNDPKIIEMLEKFVTEITGSKVKFAVK